MKKKMPPGLAKKLRKEGPDIIEKVPTLLNETYYSTEFMMSEVYDGDTIRDHKLYVFPNIAIDCDFRLARINTPEIRTRDPQEKEAGFKSKQALQNLIATHHEHTVKIQGKGKYGRWIVEIWCGDVNVSDWMLENGFAEEY